MIYYNIRIKTVNGYRIIANEIPDIETVYRFIKSYGENSSRKFYIDKVETTLFSKLTSGVAKKRLEEIDHEKRK